MILLFSVFFFLLIYSWMVYRKKLVYQSGSKTQNRSYLVGGIGLLVFLACFRGMNVGNDTFSYYKLFYFYTGQGTLQKVSAAGAEWMNSIEMGYQLLNKLVGLVTDNYQIFISIISIFCYAVLARFIEKYSLNTALSVILVFLMFYGAYMNLLRQVLALSVVLIFFDALNKNKPVWFTIGVLLATVLFHRSAIICLLFLPMSRYQCEKGFMLFSAGVAGIAVLRGWIPRILSLIGISTGYTSVVAGSSIIFAIIKNVCVFLFSWYLLNGRWKEDCHSLPKSDLNPIIADNLMSWIPFVCLLLSIGALALPVATRFELYFSVFLVVFIPRMVGQSLRKSSNIRIALAGLLIILILYNAGKIVYRPEWTTEFQYYFFWS